MAVQTVAHSVACSVGWKENQTAATTVDSKENLSVGLTVVYWAYKKAAWRAVKTAVRRADKSV